MKTLYKICLLSLTNLDSSELSLLDMDNSYFNSRLDAENYLANNSDYGRNYVIQEVYIKD